MQRFADSDARVSAALVVEYDNPTIGETVSTVKGKGYGR
jgi:hypothetical protein